MTFSFSQYLLTFSHRLALGSALAGGMVLVALVGLTLLSIAGRELAAFSFLSEWLGPIPGDYELIELGMGFAIFSFLPWAHWANGHASVDLLRPYLGRRINQLLEGVRDFLMLIVALIFARQLWLGMLDKKSYDETSFILQIPLWWGYGAAMVGAVLFALIAFLKILVLFTDTSAIKADKQGDVDLPGGGI